MVDLYAQLIIAKKRPFEKVPDRFKDAVEARLYELGYDTNGDPIHEESND